MKFPFSLIAFLAASACGSGAVPGADLHGGMDGEEEALRANARLEGAWSRRQEKTRRLRADLARAMRLDQYADACVAQDPGPAACLLTVEEFNRALEHREVPLREDDPGFPTQEDIEGSRGEVLRQILEDRYFAAAPLPGPVRDSLSALAEAELRERNRALRAHLGDSTLRAAYRDLCDLFPTAFRGREEPIYEALAASDSIRLDSARQASDSAGRRAWRTVPEPELPADALRAVRAVEPGAIAGPVRAPFGYICLREASRRRHPDVPLEDVMPLLIAWASRPVEGELGWEREMEAYYREHREEFSAPDTLTFRIWLLPETGRTDSPRRRGKESMRMDTAGLRSLTVHEKDLPTRLREELSLRPQCRLGETLGPIRSVFGIWYLQALEVRRGGRPLTLAESRPALRKLLYGWDGEDALAPARAEAEFTEKDIRTTTAAKYLMSDTSDGKPGGGGEAAAPAGKAGGLSPWERKRNDWMRRQLVLRYVSLPDPAASPVKDAHPAVTGGGGLEGDHHHGAGQ